MLAVERMRLIQYELDKQKQVSVGILSTRFQVSEETIRRDLKKITENNSNIIRVHGGAYKTNVFDNEMPVQLRETLSLDRKKSIANACLPFLRSNDTIMLDCSTTALQLAILIREKNYSMTVLTNSLKVMEVLADCDEIKLILFGGTFRKKTYSFVGHETTNMLSHYRANQCFISCAGVHPKMGITDISESEAEIRQLMIANSVEHYLLIDAFKLDLNHLSKIGNVTDFDAVITDTKPSASWLKYFKSQHTKLIFE